jgi:hypothetical protein
VKPFRSVSSTISAILRRAGDDAADLERYAPLLKTTDHRLVERLAVLLVLADDIEERCRDRRPAAMTCRLEGGEAVITVPPLMGWRPRGVGPRFEQAFGLRLKVSNGARRES